MAEDVGARRWLMLIPNGMSSLRLVLAFAFPFLPARWWAAAIVAGGVSDFIDGFVARRFGLSSWLGGILDAVADKAFVLSVLVVFAARERFEIWQVLILLSRDVVIGLVVVTATVLRAWEAFRLMKSRPWGRTATAMLYVLLFVMALWPGATGAATVLFFAGALVCLGAALDYFVEFVRAYRKRYGTS